MKKFLSLILSFCLICSLFPVTTFAEASSEPLQEDLFQLAREAFPEYGPKLHLTHSDRTSTQMLPEKDAIIYSETRSISEKDTITLTELRSGNIFVTKGTLNYAVSSSGSSASQVGPDIIGNATFTVTCTAVQEYVTMRNIGFILHPYNETKTGYLTAYGSEETSPDTKINVKETSTTYIHYGITFNSNGATKLYISFNCYIENGKVVGQVWV